MKPIFERERELGLDVFFYSNSKLFSSSSHWPIDPYELSRIYELDNLFFPHPWSKKAWLELSDCEGGYALVLLKDRGLDYVAFALWKINELEGLAHLLKVLVVPDWRGKSLGTLFLKSSIDYFVENGMLNFYLEVDESNDPAIKVYECLGFEKLHRTLNFYGSGRNAVKMGKFLE
tara:strand:- start:3 stop:527 length:525 start_codon:yes stop_codon:yes gene_type:complete